MNIIRARFIWNSFLKDVSKTRLVDVCCSNSLRTLHNVTENYTPRRALLYVPGDDERKLTKACSFKVDCIAMDCEDGVAVNRKDVARTTIRKLLDSGCVSERYPEMTVRVNSVDSELCEDDLRAVLTGPYTPPTVLLPKVDCTGHLQWFAGALHKILGEKKQKMKINLIFFIESAKGIMDLPKICDKAVEISEKSCIMPVSLVIGSDDLCADLGISRSDDGSEILYARQRLVLIAKAFNLQAIDMVDINYKDLINLKKHSIAGARMGFTGKQVIHPLQVPVVQDTFSPTPEKVNWASNLIAAFQEHQQNGKGAFVYDNSMIDKPLLRQAENIMKLAKQDKK